MSKPIANNYDEQVALLNPEKPCRAYRNLHTGLWSVKQGVVRFHTNCLFLKNADFIVSEKGRQRVLREKQKNVHAYVQGFICDRPDYFTVGVDCYEVTYNPYKCRHFVTGDRLAFSADIVCLNKQREGNEFKMRVFASNILTEAIASDTIEKVPVHLL
jgi:hypothetical protein